MQEQDLAVIILAASKDTRMENSLAKVLIPIAGKPTLEFVLQKEQLGTGHAARQTEQTLTNFEGRILVLCGDMPLIKPKTLESLLRIHREMETKCTVLTLKGKANNDFGRIIRDVDDFF